MNVTKLIVTTAKTVGKAVCAHKEGILGGIGVAMMISGAVVGYFAGHKAEKAVEEKKEEANLEEGQDLTVKEKVKATWKIFAPVVAMEALGAAAVIYGGHLSHKQSAAFAAACAMSETAFNDYASKVKKCIGEEKEKELRESVSSAKALDILPDSKPAPQGTIVFDSGRRTKVYDSLTDRTFEMDVDELRQAIFRANDILYAETTLSMNELYDEFNTPALKHMDIGDDIGWRVEDGSIEAQFSAIVLEDGLPCLVLSFNRTPKPIYPF